MGLLSLWNKDIKTEKDLCNNCKKDKKCLFFKRHKIEDVLLVESSIEFEKDVDGLVVPVKL